MVTHIEAVAGIAISLFLFYISYRQTIGAAKERVHAANTEIDSIIFKRTVLDGLSLTAPMVRQLTEGKALAHKVASSELHTVDEILSILFSATLESDFVPQEKRSALLQAITALSVSPGRGNLKEAEIIAAEKTRSSIAHRELVLATMAVIASLAGGLLSQLPNLGKISGQIFSLGNRQALLTAVLVSTTSLLILSVTLWVLRFRASEEQSAYGAENRSSQSFERDVLKMLQRFRIPTNIAPPESSYDFDARIRGKRTAIEVKNWPRRVPASMIRFQIKKLKSLIDSGKAEQSLLITREPVGFPELAEIDPRVRVLGIAELRNYLAHP
jgi:hypothetical protein